MTKIFYLKQFGSPNILAMTKQQFILLLKDHFKPGRLERAISKNKSMKVKSSIGFFYMVTP